MMQNTLSIKDLRQNLPQVIQEIQKGKRFTLIYRSRPVGQIGPIESNSAAISPQQDLSFFTDPKISFKFRTKKSAVQLVREERD